MAIPVRAGGLSLSFLSTYSMTGVRGLRGVGGRVSQSKQTDCQSSPVPSPRCCTFKQNPLDCHLAPLTRK